MTTGQSTQAQINVTPMIDVLLVLLIIFMVITPLAPVGLQASIPQDGPVSAAPPQPPLVVQVRANGMTLVNSQGVPVAELGAKLLAIFQGRPGSVMFVDGAAGLTYGEVAHVIDIAKGAGISTVGLLPRSMSAGLK